MDNSSKKTANFSMDKIQDASILTRALKWTKAPYDKATREEVEKLIRTDSQQVHDCFSKNLDFGTGGIRALMGVGTAKVNVYTFLNITEGLSQYVESIKGGKGRITIGYDARENSYKLAHNIAAWFVKRGMEVWVFDRAIPTPILSFSIRKKSADLGVMITASHNPKDYNGYKVYGADGGQLAPPTDREVMKYVSKVEEQAFFHEGEYERLTEAISYLDDVFLDTYYESCRTIIGPFASHTFGANALALSSLKTKILYTPLHGVGGEGVRGLLQKMGWQEWSFVESQIKQDSSFPTVSMPNPEDDRALEEGIRQLETKGLDLLVATDADADRIRIALALHPSSQAKKTATFVDSNKKNVKPQIILFDGNQMACLLADYCLKALVDTHQLKDFTNPFIAKTIVTSEMVRLIANQYAVRTIDTLPGFKYIGKLIREDASNFLMGLEDSCGYLYGVEARDKDGILMALFFAIIVEHWARKGKNIYERLKELYCEHGYFFEKIISKQLDDDSQAERILKKFRKSKLEKIDTGEEVFVLFRQVDLGLQKTEERLVDKRGKCSEDAWREKAFAYENLGKTAAIMLFFQSSHLKLKIIFRPSGTEPKVKFYAQIQKYRSKKETERENTQREATSQSMDLREMSIDPTNAVKQTKEGKGNPFAHIAGKERQSMEWERLDETMRKVQEELFPAIEKNLLQWIFAG